ncbi:hypothetical protein, partial [uncultured Campylobacter sp.]|uniref:hypothetical protein n=1 Tax=uncultured Campylobacter sp. TaxID=218934 RepID=UPI002625FB10
EIVKLLIAAAAWSSREVKPINFKILRSKISDYLSRRLRKRLNACSYCSAQVQGVLALPLARMSLARPRI